jgi:hypothetical protein
VDLRRLFHRGSAAGRITGQLGLGWLLLAGAASADATPNFSGRWQASPLMATWTVDSWPSECGPKPSGGGEPGAFVSVSEHAGELRIAGAAQPYATSSCWESVAGLQRVSHSASARSWTSVCKTKPSEVKQVVLRSTLNASDNSLQFEENAQYRFFASGKTCSASARRSRQCSASARRSRQYQLVERAPETVSPAASALVKETATAAELPIVDCSEPGPAHSLNVTPAYKLLRRGEDATFSVRLRDAQGCNLASAAVLWSFEPTLPGVQVRRGKVSAAPDASEGQTQLLARAGNLSARVQLQVVSADTVTALLAPPTIATTLTSPGSDSAGAATLVEATAAVAEDLATRRKVWFGAFVTLTAVLLGGLGVVVLRQARRPAVSSPRLSLQPATAAAATDIALAGGGKICPTCGTMYGSEAQFCGKDGVCLVQTN